MAEPPPPYYASDPKFPLNAGANPGVYPNLPTAPPAPDQQYYQYTAPPQPGNYPRQPNFTEIQFQVPPSQPPQNVTTIIHVSLGPYPCDTFCPHCQMSVRTRTRHESGVLTWLLCGGMFIFGMWLCCLMPFCIDALQDVDHYCSNCRKFLGRYKRI